MCKGYAVVINDKKIIGKGNIHSDIFTENNLKEDDFLKVNVIYDDSKEEGYRIDIDRHEEDKDSTQLKHYQQLGMVTKEGEIIDSYLKRMVAYCKKREAEIFRVLCRNMQSATIKGDIILYNTIIGTKDSKTSKLIAEFSKNRDWKECTLTNLLEWVAEKKKD